MKYIIYINHGYRAIATLHVNVTNKLIAKKKAYNWMKKNLNVVIYKER